MANPVLIEVTRSGRVESRHHGAVAVVDARGTLVWSAGDIEAAIYPRSAFKMLQALPLVETGAADAFAVTEEELALACASHSGETRHVGTIAAWLARIGAREADLACGPHNPREAAWIALIREGRLPTRLHNNCSGKHTGFLTTARHLSAPIAGYTELDHPVQVRVRSAIAAMADLNAQRLPAGVDGCTAPNYFMPLRALALALARFADPSALEASRAAACARLYAAMVRYPFLVAGTGRACTAMIEAAMGTAIVKTGAEGVYVAAAREAGLGIALKIDDGAARAAETAMASLLVRFASVSAAALGARLAPPVLTTRGNVIGEIRWVGG